MKKKILNHCCLGLGLGIVLCCMMYVGMTLFYKDTSAVKTDTGKVSEGEPKNPDELSDVQSGKQEFALHSNEKNVAVMTSADTLIPQKVEQLLEIEAPTRQIKNVQGGCVVGDYVYQAFYFADVAEKQANNECMILKCELSSGKVVQKSESLQLNHVNDLTYNAKLNCLVVGHNQPMANLISFVDIDTLEVVKTFPIDYYLYSISYNAARDQYVLGVQGSQNFRILDANFNAVGDVIKASSRSAKSTTQGSDCDDDYIYFTLHKPNIIVVYDWDGNFVSLIELDDYIPSDDYEPEDLTVEDGSIYINCGQKNSTIFKISDFVPKPIDAEKE